MKFDHVLCHYSEIGLKGKNRRFFEDRLRQNILKTLKIRCPDSVELVKLYHGRLVIKLKQESADLDCIENALKDVMGLAYFAPAFESKQELNTLKEDAHALLSDLEF